VRPPLFRLNRNARRVTIRFRLGLAVAVALSPVLMLGVVQAGLSFDHDARHRRFILTEAAQRSVVAAQGKTQAALSVLTILVPQTGALDCAPNLARAKAALRFYDNLIRLDASGAVRCAAAPVSQAAARSLSADAALLGPLRAGAASITVAAPFAFAPHGPAALAAVRARQVDGAFDGALIGVLSAASLSPALTDRTLPEDTQLALLDEEARIAVADRPQAFAPPPRNWRAEALSPSGLLFTAASAAGAPRVEVIEPLLGDRLFLAVSAPTPGLLSWARLNALYHIVLPLLGWIGAWTAVWIVTDRVVIRWLSYLDRIAAIYAKGRFSVRPVQAESAPAEIRAFAETLDSMADAIVARDLSLRESLDHKDTLMREIHHRVKNNLQIITSLLNMQQRALSDPTAREAMSDTRQRISALALIYRALYQSPDLRSVDVRQFLEELIGQLSASDGARPTLVRTELYADDLEIDPDKLAPLALFAVEGIAIARKHTFPDGHGVIRVRFAVDTDTAYLEIADNGAGQADPGADDGVGGTLMNAFARQLRGRMERSTAEDGVRSVRLIFPRPDAPKDTTPVPFQLSATSPRTRAEGAEPQTSA